MRRSRPTWRHATAFAVLAVAATGYVLVTARPTAPEQSFHVETSVTTVPATPEVSSTTTTTTVDLAAALDYAAALHNATSTTTAPPTTRPVPVPARPRATAAPGSSSSGRCAIPDYICQRESGFNPQAVNPTSGAGGKYQFMPTTWNAVAARAGRPDLVGVHPSQASEADQDALAVNLWDGGRGCGNWSACG